MASTMENASCSPMRRASSLRPSHFGLREPPPWGDVMGYGSFGLCVPGAAFPVPEAASRAALCEVTQLPLPGSSMMGMGGAGGGEVGLSICGSSLCSGFSCNEYRAT